MVSDFLVAFRNGRKYITLCELLGQERNGELRLQYCRANNSIQVRSTSGGYIGCLKFCFKPEELEALDGE